MSEKFCSAIVLAAGSGTRVGGDLKKQYIPIDGKPLLYYSLRVFDKSPIINEIILVVSEDDERYCYDEIIDRFSFTKPITMTIGGAERYNSVYSGLQSVNENCDYVFIHDGARPCVDEDIIARAYEDVQAFDACVVGMPVTDTIRRVLPGDDCAEEVLDRNEIWGMQTPQVFEYHLILDSYSTYIDSGETEATDDAMIVEWVTGHPIRITEGTRRNIKVTTPDDLLIAEAFLRQRKQR